MTTPFYDCDPKAKFREIVEAVALELHCREVIPEFSRVIPIARDQGSVPHMVGDRDILLRPRGFRGINSTDLGAGRWHRRVQRYLDVVARSRTALDPVGSDKQFLLRADLGHLDFEERIIDVLDMWDARDADGEMLTCAPIRFVTVSDAGKEFSADGKWGASAIRFEIEYALKLDVSEFQ